MSKALKVNVGGRKVVDLGGAGFHYVGAGGQAEVYQSNGIAYKLYHDSKNSMPTAKMQELMQILAPNVIKPLEILYSVDGKPVGYTMKYLAGMQPVCKFFTKSFKLDNNLTPDLIAELVKQLQLTVDAVHKSGCLIVDLNELNVLIGDDFVSPHLIDTDSFQTPSFRATAIMDSVRDRVTRQGHFSEATDWFSFAVMATQLYLNIHPYKGSHPKYLPGELNKRMDDNVSIFHKGVKLPIVCNPFSVIPSRHLNWLKDVFLNNDRSLPPLADGCPISLHENVVLIGGTNRFEVKELFTLDSDILFRMEQFGVDYFVTRKSVYRQQDVIWSGVSNYKKVMLCTADSGDLIITGYDGKLTLSFLSDTGMELSRTSCSGAFYRNNAIYTANRGHLYEHTFTRIGSKLLPQVKSVAQVSEFNTKLYPGVVVQDLLGKTWLTLPYALGRCHSYNIPELNGFRVIEAKCERNVCVVIMERNGIYSRAFLEFTQDYASYTYREDKDVSYDGINATVLENGMCILLGSDEIQLTRKGTTHKISDPPIGPNMRLFNKGVSVFFLNGTSVYSLKMK